MLWAVEAKRSHDWDMASMLWEALTEPNRDRKKRSTPYTFLDVHPFAKRIKAEIAKHKKTQPKEAPIPISSLRGMFKNMGVKGA